MAMRVTGMYSGLDTETIIQDLVAAKRTKVDAVKKQQTRLEWKQDIWKELNTKIKNFYSKTLDSMRLQGSYTKKTTKISNSSIAEILTSDTAMNSVQTLKVNKLARAGYLTGGEVKKDDGGTCTSGTKLVDIGDGNGNKIAAGSKISVTANGKTTEITVTDSMTIGDLTSKLNSAGVNANFDSKTQRFFIGAKASGAKADFAITASNADGTNALKQLGMLANDEKTKEQYTAIVGLRNDADAYQKAIDKEAASRLTSYISKSTSLTETMKKQQKNLDELKAACEQEMGAEEFDKLVHNTDGALDTLKDKIVELKEQAKGENLTEEQKEELNKEIGELEKKLDSVTQYQTVEKGLDNTKTQLDEVQSYINPDDNSASQKLTDEVTAELDAKIAEAENVLTDWDSLMGSTGATRIIGQDAEIELNGATFTSSSNTFEVNGLTITCNATTAENEEVTLTTQDDTSGIYDMIKNFIKEYSSLINEMDKLYNADAAKGYDPLTDEEKDEMSEKEIEKWEEKVKASLLRRDSTLNTVSSAFREIMSAGVSVNGKTLHLSDFGVETLGYFDAADNERNAYHIYGDEDDSAVSSKTNILNAKIISEPDTVMDFFSQLTKKLYDKTFDLMKSVKDHSSAYTVYEDKRMKSEYDEYTKKIADLEAKLTAYEDKWYKKFSAMETAMAKMQSNASAITGLLGGS